MSVNKTPQGRWRARVASGGKFVDSKTFDTRTEARDWHDRQVQKLRNGEWIDPKRGKESLGSVIDRWLEVRKGTVAGKTFQTDEYAMRVHVPESLRRRPINSIRSGDIEDHFVALLDDLSLASVQRFRGSLSSMFAWAVRQELISKNPVTDAQMPRGTGTDEKAEVFPFALDELRQVYEALTERGGEWADLAYFLGLTGLRWGELMALRVRDIQQVPYPAVLVSRSAPDGQAIRTVTKGGSNRSLPLAEELLPIVERWSKGRELNDLLFSYRHSGRRIGARNWGRKVNWAEHCMGRTIHQLRHTAATIWLTNGVDPKTVQTWLGHASMTITVDTYAHWMGSDADRAAIARMNTILRRQDVDTGSNLRVLGSEEPGAPRQG